MERAYNKLSKFTPPAAPRDAFTTRPLARRYVQSMKITFGDNVRVLTTPETEANGVAGKLGSVYGETTPSHTNIEVIGELKEDYAINVFFEDIDKSIWFTSEHLEYVDHGAGTEISIGDIKQENRGV